LLIIFSLEVMLICFGACDPSENKHECRGRDMEKNCDLAPFWVEERESNASLVSFPKYCKRFLLPVRSV